MLSATDILNAKVLVVDDQDANVKLLERLLGDAGYTQVSSTLRSQDVPALHRENHYDLILLDLQMPGMDGFEVMEALKGDVADSYLPVVVLTAQPGHKLRALQAARKISSASLSTWSKSRRAFTTCWKCGFCTSGSRATTSCWRKRCVSARPSCAKASCASVA